MSVSYYTPCYRLMPTFLEGKKAASCYEKAGDPSRAVNLYRAALSGPLREDTRTEVENMLHACLIAVKRKPVKSIPSA